MGIIDFKVKLLDKITAKIKKIIIGLNKEEKKLIIQNVDRSTNIIYKNEIGLSNEEILGLPSKDVGDFLKHKTILNIKAALKDYPEEMQRYMAIYNPAAFSTGASLVTATAPMLTDKTTLMASGDFIKQLPGAIEASIPHDVISIKDVAEAKIIEADDKSED